MYVAKSPPSTAAPDVRAYLDREFQAVARELGAEQLEAGDAREFRAVGDGVTDDTASLAAWWAAGQQGTKLILPAGTYLTSQPLVATVPVQVRGDFGARIKLTAPADAVMQFNFMGGFDGWDYLSDVRGLILDGGGFADYGLDLMHVISGVFDDIRATNVVEAGMYWHWIQLCTFTNFTCSANVEDFTTTPINGIREEKDGHPGFERGSSANLVTNPCIEHVSGAGIKCETLVNTVFVNGTSEGNDIGIDFGEAAGDDCIGNDVYGMDLEENATTDVMLRATAKANNFYGLKAGFNSPAIQVIGTYNNFFGGFTGGFDFDAASAYNNVYGTRLLGAGDTITDAGFRNMWRDVMNFSTAMPIADSPLSLFDGVTAPSAVAGFAQIYVDVADGDLKVKFGDGTVKTLATDT